MPIINVKKRLILLIYLASLNSSFASGNSPCILAEPAVETKTLAEQTIEEQLGWVASDENRCGGYYLEDPFPYSESLLKNHLISITSNQTLFAQHGTSILEGGVTMTQKGQQIKSNKACLYRDPLTGKISAIDLIGNVNLREPENLVVAYQGHLNLKNKTQSLKNIVYRTAVYGKVNAKPPAPSNALLQQTRKIYQLSAWGTAKEFRKDQPKIYELTDASYSTCAPNAIFWQLKAKHIVLNKITGRGTATHSRLYIEKVPILYTPYVNFPIDNRRQTGFLFPYFGSSNKFGPYLRTPFYWNLAPNYDTTITPVFMSKRGFQFVDLFRYITHSSRGQTVIAIVPNDKAFTHLQTTSTAEFQNNPSSYIQANLHRLQNAGSMRGSVSWQNETQLSPLWSSSVDFNYVTDDYYLQDFGHDISEMTENQLVQKAEVNYKGQHWYFTSRFQQYQTLHPVDTNSIFLNQYSRLPQLILDGDYPDQAHGFNYFVNNELTHFDIRNMPGSSPTDFMPVGDRLHIQPGISWSYTQPYMYAIPRAQFFLNKYQIHNNSPAMTPYSTLAVPIVDLDTGLYLDREAQLFNYAFKQTLEPRFYYLWVPYHNQTQYPVFDTTLNNMTFDQLFLYNRFSGLDRIGDTNQITLGVTTRIIDSVTGFEKARLALGEIIYFTERKVTICSVDNINCLTPDGERENTLRRSPLSGILNYHLNESWSFTGNLIWNTQLNQVDNQTFAFQYHPSNQRVINLGYNFVRNGDPQAGIPPGDPTNDLKQLDVSFGWPVSLKWSVIGRWTKSINQAHFQNLIFGLQYDSCCWAVRFMGGKTFTNLDVDGRPNYYNQYYLQIALKGLGTFGQDPTQYVSTNIGGYNSNFGQDF